MRHLACPTEHFPRLGMTAQTAWAVVKTRSDFVGKALTHWIEGLGREGKRQVVTQWLLVFRTSPSTSHREPGVSCITCASVYHCQMG